MLYLENAAFGGGVVKCTDLAHGTSTDTLVYAGQVKGAKKTATEAKAVDMSQFSGNYKGKYTIRLNLVEDFAVTGTMTFLDVNFYYFATESAEQSAAKTFSKFRIPLTELKKAKITPIEFALPSYGSTDYRYVRLELATDATTVTSGAIVVAVEPTPM